MLAQLAWLTWTLSSVSIYILPVVLYGFKIWSLILREEPANISQLQLALPQKLFKKHS